MNGVPRSRLMHRVAAVANPRMRLICLPYAGAGTAVYRSWRLPAELDVEVWTVRLAGRETRRAESPQTRLEPVVRELADGLADLLDLPFAIFGHSMGALLAFELTRSLRRRRGRMPCHLFLSAHRAAHLPSSRRPVSVEPVEAFLNRLRVMSGPGSSAVDDPELLLHLAPVIRADFALCESYSYRPEPPLDVPATCFCAVDDPEVDVAEVEAWRRQFTRPGRLYMYPGGHLFIRAESVDILSRMALELSRQAESDLLPKDVIA